MDYRYQTNPYQMYTPYSGQMQPSPMMQPQQSTTLQNQPMQVSNPSSGFTCQAGNKPGGGACRAS